MTPSDQQRILAALLDAGHITADQRRRVERALATGKELMEALKDTPLVEPMIFYRAAHGLGATPSPNQTPPPGSEPYRDEGTPSQLEGVRRDSREGINILELDLDEAEVPSRRPMPTPLPIRKPAAAAATPAKKAPAAPPPNVLQRPGDAHAFLPPAGTKMPEFDLRNDEGINTVKIVNEALAPSSFEGAALRVVAKADGCRLLRFGVSGANVATDSLEHERADLYMTRLRVMARIQPRTPGTTRKAFNARIDGRELTGLVESTVDGEKTGTVTVWFVKRTG